MHSSLLRRRSESPVNLQECRDYMSVFEEYINDSQYWPSSSGLPRKYHLIEDIAILYFVSSANSHDKINLVFWEYLVSANIFQRNAASLRDRYLTYLSHLTHHDVTKIGSYVMDKNPINAFLEFSTQPDGTRTMTGIVPAGAARQYGRPQTTQLFEISSYDELAVTAKLCRKYNIAPGSIFSNSYLQTVEQKLEDSPVKKVKLQINQESEIQLEYLGRRFGLERKSLLEKLL